MSKVEEVAKKIEDMPLSEHLILAASALESLDKRMDSSRIELILMLLDIKLQKYRLCKRMGITNEIS